MVTSSSEHWEAAWRDRDPATTSWFQADPALSLTLMSTAGVTANDPIVDVGGGVSALAFELVRRGFSDVTVIDLAAGAIDMLDRALRDRFGSHEVNLVVADILTWTPSRAYRLWHDRAANHFLTDPADRRSYAALAARTVVSGGYLVLAAFAPEGPEQCSGLTVHRADPASLAAEFSPDFDLQSVHHDAHETPWNATQSFHYLLLRRL